MAIRNKRHSAPWSVVEAKTHFDEVIDEVEVGAAQIVARNGDALAVLASTEQWEVESIQDLAAFFASAGLDDGELIIPPRTGASRNLEW